MQAALRALATYHLPRIDGCGWHGWGATAAWWRAGTACLDGKNKVHTYMLPRLFNRCATCRKRPAASRMARACQWWARTAWSARARTRRTAACGSGLGASGPRRSGIPPSASGGAPGMLCFCGCLWTYSACVNSHLINFTRCMGDCVVSGCVTQQAVHICPSALLAESEKDSPCPATCLCMSPYSPVHWFAEKVYRLFC